MKNISAAEQKQLKKQKIQHILGYVVISLALVGFCTLVFLGVKGVGMIFDNSDKMLEYQKMISTVVMHDPAPFDDPANAGTELLLQSAAWAVIKNENADRYSYDESGAMLIPAADLDLYAAKIFGTDVKLTHQTFGSNTDLEFTYNEETAMYKVPVVGMLAYYTPYVTNMKRSGDTILLKVGYVSGTNAWLGDINGQVYIPEVEKYMLYTLEKNDKDSYVLQSVAEYTES